MEEKKKINNIACRIFKEQLMVINQLPEEDRAKVLYLAVMNAFNQFENQIENQNENQNENAYISLSLSLSNISKSILDLLSKNIVFKEYSNNYGGNREKSGRKPVKNQELTKKCDSQCDCQNDGQSAVSVSEQIREDKTREENKKEIDKEKDAVAKTALVQKFVDRWNNGIINYGVPMIKEVSDERRSKLLDRMKQAKSYYPDKDEVDAIFTVIADSFENSRFLRGENNAKFKFGIDFVLQKSSFIKMYEGQYNDRE